MSAASGEVLCAHTPRPTIFPPPPTGPLIRQQALGAESPPISAMICPEQLPDYYDKIVIDTSKILNVCTVLAAMESSLPSNVQPHVKYIPHSDRFGLTFTLILREVENKPVENIKRISEFDIDPKLAWEYVACEFLRHCFIGASPIRLKKIGSKQMPILLETLVHQGLLHDSIARVFTQTQQKNER